MTHAEAIQKAQGKMYQVVIYKTHEPQGLIMSIGTLQECAAFLEEWVKQMVKMAYVLNVDIRGNREMSLVGTESLITGYNLYWDSSVRTHRITVDRY